MQLNVDPAIVSIQRKALPRGNLGGQQSLQYKSIIGTVAVAK